MSRTESNNPLELSIRTRSTSFNVALFNPSSQSTSNILVPKGRSYVSPGQRRRCYTDLFSREAAADDSLGRQPQVVVKRRVFEPQSGGMSYVIMPPLRGSEPISRSRTWGWHPRLSHNTASRFKKKLMYNNEAVGLGWHMAVPSGLRPIRQPNTFRFVCMPLEASITRIVPSLCRPILRLRQRNSLRCADPNMFRKIDAN